jgi:hypothetical protein
MTRKLAITFVAAAILLGVGTGWALSNAHHKGAAAGTQTPSPSVAATGMGPRTGESPEVTLRRFLVALGSPASHQFCGFVIPAQQHFCVAKTKALIAGTPWPNATLSGEVDVKQGVVVGDRALVSNNGTVCIARRCRRAALTMGMPTPAATFDQAWAIATGTGPSAGWPLRKIDGKWFVDLA